MHRALRGSLCLLFTMTTVAAAQAKPSPRQAGAPAKIAAAITWSDLAGEWNGKSVRGKSDSVITTFTTTFAADKSITLAFPKRKPIPSKLVTMAGDSVVIETDKYDSITRPGHQTSVRMTLHVGNHKMWGPFHATFDDGKSLDGTSTAAHKRK